MTNFDYYIKGGKTRKGWSDFANNFYDKGTGRAIDRYNEWLLKEHKEPILDDVEREYLSNVIKPFRNDVRYVYKLSNITDRGVDHRIVIVVKNHRITLPPFDSYKKMYANMKPNYMYSLKDLNL